MIKLFTHFICLIHNSNTDTDTDTDTNTDTDTDTDTDANANANSNINSSVPIVFDLEGRCAKYIWSCLNSDNSKVKTIAKSAKSSCVSNFGNNDRYLRY